MKKAYIYLLIDIAAILYLVTHKFPLAHYFKTGQFVYIPVGGKTDANLSPLEAKQRDSLKTLAKQIFTNRQYDVPVIEYHATERIIVIHITQDDMYTNDYFNKEYQILPKYSFINGVIAKNKKGHQNGSFSNRCDRLVNTFKELSIKDGRCITCEVDENSSWHYDSVTFRNISIKWEYDTTFEVGADVTAYKGKTIDHYYEFSRLFLHGEPMHF